MGYSDGASTYQPGDTITVNGDIDYTGTATLTAQWELASYTVTISNTNTSSGSASISVPYGGSNTVTVTPSTSDGGFYLSSVSCPSGYTCSGYNTGSSYTGQQTVTVTNNNTTSGGTLSFTGAHVYTLSQMCSRTTTSTAFAYDGTNYWKFSNGVCYSKSVAYVTWEYASSKCPAGTIIPSRDVLSAMASAVGTTEFHDGLESASAGAMAMWTSTEDPSDSSKEIYMYLDRSVVAFGPVAKTVPAGVNCLVQ